MSSLGYLPFVGVSLLVICTPGQDTALTIRNTLLGGRSAGVSTAAGVATGQAVWTAATSAGLAVVLTAPAQLFVAIRLLGAGYLVYLGARSLLKAAAGFDAAGQDPHRSRSRLAVATPFWQGLLSNLSNGKMVAFFISLLPQFAAPHPSFLLLLALGINFSLMTLVWLVAYAFVVERASRFLRRMSVRRIMEALLGAVLVGLGLRLSAEAVGA